MSGSLVTMLVRTAVKHYIVKRNLTTIKGAIFSYQNTYRIRGAKCQTQ